MDCGILMSKSVLIFLSLLFWAAGAGLAYVGAYVIRSYNSVGTFIEEKYAMTPAMIIIGISVVLFIFGVLGCCATVWESKFGLGFFFLIIMAVFAAEVVALVFGLIYQERAKAELEHTMYEIFGKYDGHNTDSITVDTLQSGLRCCGVTNYTDWSNTTWFKTHNNTVPLSCCKNGTTACTGSLAQPDLIYQQACKVNVQSLLKDVLQFALLVLLGFAIIKFFGMMSICVITCRCGSKRRDYQPLYA